MKSKVLALSQADHKGNVNFAFVTAPAGVASKNFVSQAQLLELGIIKDIKDKQNVLRVCITGITALPAIGKDLEYQIRTNLRGTTIEIAGASYKLNEQRTIARIESQTGRKTAMLKQELEIAQSLGLPVGYAELSAIVNNRLDTETASSRARNAQARGNFGAKPVMEREDAIRAED